MIPETRYTRTPDGFHIAYQIAGTGPVDIVFVPGWFGNVDLIWEQPEIVPFLERVASFARLILFDRRGTGLSDQFTDPPDLETMMDDIRAVMDAAGSKRAVLIGLTIGGAIASVFAAALPERTLGLVLIQVTAKVARTEDYPWGDSLEEHDRIVCGQLARYRGAGDQDDG